MKIRKRKGKKIKCVECGKIIIKMTNRKYCKKCASRIAKIKRKIWAKKNYSSPYKEIGLARKFSIFKI